MNLLRAFINEELVWNYWMRRPRNNQIATASDEIEAQRREVFNDSSKQFDNSVDNLKRSIEVASDIDGIYDSLKSLKCKPHDIAADATELDHAVEMQDLESVRRIILMGLQKWSKDKLASSEHNDYDAYSISGHPMRTPSSGIPSLKRSMGY